jgi:hypothetical protein
MADIATPFYSLSPTIQEDGQEEIQDAEDNIIRLTPHLENLFEDQSENATPLYKSFSLGNQIRISFVELLFKL